MAISTKFKPGDKVYYKTIEDDFDFESEESAVEVNSDIFTVVERVIALKKEKAFEGRYLQDKPMVWIRHKNGGISYMPEHKVYLYKPKKEMPSWL